VRRSSHHILQMVLNSSGTIRPLAKKHRPRAPGLVPDWRFERGDQGRLVDHRRRRATLMITPARPEAFITSAVIFSPVAGPPGMITHQRINRLRHLDQGRG